MHFRKHYIKCRYVGQRWPEYRREGAEDSAEPVKNVVSDTRGSAAKGD